MMDKKKKELSKATRSSSSSRLSGLFKSMMGKKPKRVVVALIDDDDKNIKEISSMIRAHNADVDVVCARDGIDGLVLLKTHAEDIRLCLADMVMPGCSGIEMLNRARADPQLEHITVALMTEFSGGSQGKKTLSHFQVSDDRGDPVSVLIKPLHQALIADLVDRAVRNDSAPVTPTQSRKHSDSASPLTSSSDRGSGASGGSTGASAGGGGGGGGQTSPGGSNGAGLGLLLGPSGDSDPDWQRVRSRSEWSTRRGSTGPGEIPKLSQSSDAPPRASPSRELASSSPRVGSPRSSASAVGSAVSSRENSPRRVSTSPRTGSFILNKDGTRTQLSSSGSMESPGLTRKKSVTISGDSREEFLAASAASRSTSPLETSGTVPRSVSNYQLTHSSSSEQLPSPSPGMTRSTSMYTIDNPGPAPSPRGVRKGNTSSPRLSRAVLGKNSLRGKEKDLLANAAGFDGEQLEEESRLEQGSKRWSMRHNQEGIVDESKGVNDIMFDSISSLDRSQSVTRSISMDQLNWDEVA